jgi:hypothetical protein
MVTDLFALKRSKKFIIQNSQAARVDLGLTIPPSPPDKAITGKVTHCGRPIPNATVVVVDAQLNPVTFTRTDPAGIYRIAGLNARLYGLTATATGFSAAAIMGISLMESQVKIADIELEKQTRCVFSWYGCAEFDQNEPQLCLHPGSR